MAEVNGSFDANATLCHHKKHIQLFNECDDRDFTVFLNLLVCFAVIAGIAVVGSISVRLCRSRFAESQACLAEAEMAEFLDDSAMVSM